MMNVTEIKKFFNQLGCVGLKVPRESNKGSDPETGYPGELEASSDFGYLRTRRSWSQILFPSRIEKSSCYGGIALKLLVSQGKCDLEICGLPCCHDTPSLNKEEKTVVVVPTFYSGSCEMADRKRPEKSKEPSGNVDSSATENSFRKENKHFKKLTKSILNQPEAISSSNSSLFQPKPPWISPASSYQSLIQDKQATELKLLSQLHSSFKETTNVHENYISLLDRKK